ncbi:M1 family aminopeptidase [Candidatus Margulisiibacteriota bacterium]
MIKRVSFFLFVFISLFLNTQNFLAAANQNYSKYSINARLDENSRTLHCQQKVKFTNNFKKSLNKIYFVINNNQIEPNPFLSPLMNDVGYLNGYEPGPVKINSASTDGNVALEIIYEKLSHYLKLQKYSEDKLLFYLALPRSLKPGQIININFDFSVKIPAAYATVNSERWFYKGTYILRFGWYPVEVARSGNDWIRDRWLTAKHLVEKIELDLPRKYTCALPGPTTEVNSNNDRKTVISKIRNPIISCPIAFSPDFRIVKRRTGAGVEIEVFYLEERSSMQARRIAKIAAEAVEYYSKHFSLPGFSKINIINSPFSGMWGMAADGTVILGDHAFSTAHILVQNYLNRFISHLVAHEVGHLWAGIGVPVDHNRENVFSEGLTEYITYAYFEDKFGKYKNLFEPKSPAWASYFLTTTMEGLGSAASFTARDNIHFDYMKSVRDGWDEPVIIDIEDSNLNTMFIKDYRKGFILFSNLENFVGKKVFRKSLREYFNSYSAANSNADFFQSILEKNSTQDLDPYFSAWFYGISSIDYAFRKVTSTNIPGRKYKTKVTITKKGQAPSNLEVEALLVDRKKVRQTIKGAEDGSEVTFVTKAPLKNVFLDPGLNVLEKTKLNNTAFPKTDYYIFGDQGALIRKKPLHNYFIGLYPQGPYKILNNDESGLGFSIVGKDFISHKWQFGASVLYTLDEIGGSIYDPTSSQVFGQVDFYLPRGNFLSMYTVYDTRDIWESALMARFPMYSEVESGFYGHFYYPKTFIDFGLMRRDFDFSKPYYSVFAKVNHVEINSLLVSAAKLELAPAMSGFNDQEYLKADLAALLPMKLGGILMVPKCSLGYGRNLPSELRYNSIRMRGSSISTYGSKYLDFGIDFPFAIDFGRKDRLLNFGLVRGFACAFFMEAGTAWDGEFSNWDRTKKINAGVEFCTLFSTIADMKFPLTFGYAVNLADSNKPGNDSEFYFSFNTPINLYAMIFGY